MESQDIVSFNHELQQVLNDAGKQSIGNGIQPKSTQRYSRIVIQHLNREEEEAEGQKQITRTVMIKVLVLKHKSSKQSNPILAWFMSHKIYHMYSYIRKK